MNEEEKQALENIKGELISLTKRVSDLLESQTDKSKEKLENWMKDRVELWCRIYNEGGVVSKERLHETWEGQMKKDTRGLGGFFVGKASLQWTANNKVVLTARASEAIEAWTGQPIEEYAKKFKT